MADQIDPSDVELLEWAGVPEFPESEGPECEDCGQPADVVDLNAYGPGKGKHQCTVCYIADNRIDTMRINTAVLGLPAEVLVLTEGTTCSNCGTHVLADGALHDPVVDHPDWVGSPG